MADDRRPRGVLVHDEIVRTVISRCSKTDRRADAGPRRTSRRCSNLRGKSVTAVESTRAFTYSGSRYPIADVPSIGWIDRYTLVHGGGTRNL